MQQNLGTFADGGAEPERHHCSLAWYELMLCPYTPRNGIEEFVVEMLVRLNLTSRPKIHAGREPLPGKLDNLMFRLFMAHSGHFG